MVVPYMCVAVPLFNTILAWGYQLFNSELLSDDSITYDSLAKYILLHHLKAGIMKRQNNY